MIMFGTNIMKASKIHILFILSLAIILAVISSFFTNHHFLQVVATYSTKDNTNWTELKQIMCRNMKPNPKIWSTLFELARVELEFDTSRILTAKADEEFVQSFFTFTSGGIGYSSSDETNHLVYLRVWKAGNDQIRKNLDATLSQSEKDGGKTWIEKGQLLEAFTNGYPGLWSPIPQNHRNNTCVVTAVRDPIEHFVSGYNEMEWRVLHNDHHHWINPKKDVGKNTLLFARWKNGTDMRFEQFIVDYIGGAGSSGLFPSIPHSIIYHTFSMAGILWELQRRQQSLTAYLPSIKNMDVEFPKFLREKCKGLPREATQTFKSKFDHPSQNDEHGFYSAAKRVVWSNSKGDNKFARALCAIHALDYACFDLIPVPIVCQTLFDRESFREKVIKADASET